MMHQVACISQENTGYRELHGRCMAMFGQLVSRIFHCWFGFRFLSELLKRIENGGWDDVLQELKALQACDWAAAPGTMSSWIMLVNSLWQRSSPIRVP